MTEAIIITAIIVGGIVALAWLLLHFAFKAWKAEKILASDQKPLTSNVHINSAAQPVSAEEFRRRVKRDLSFDLN
jgi:hypothetical protein